ncbi:MAG TPA: hypothetical protein PLJ62_11770, partial [Thermoflexales bacterium]|nr:hypothetical protein [Thermoflexales bacterium]
IQPALSLPKGRTALLRAAVLLRMTGLLLSKTRAVLGHIEPHQRPEHKKSSGRFVFFKVSSSLIFVSSHQLALG